MNHDCKAPKFCETCDRIEEAQEQTIDAGLFYVVQMFHGDDQPAGGNHDSKNKRGTGTRNTPGRLCEEAPG